MKQKIQKLYQSQTYQTFMDITPSFKHMYMSYAEFHLLRDRQRQVNHRLLFLRQNLARAAGRAKSYEITIDLDYLYQLGEAQNWKCALSGRDLEFRRGGGIWLNQYCNPNSCSIDRIDNAQGYIEGNVQLVTWRANAAKSGMHNVEFVSLCHDVSTHQRKKNP
jgi:hypothetical protein